MSDAKHETPTDSLELGEHPDDRLVIICDGDLHDSSAAVRGRIDDARRTAAWSQTILVRDADLAFIAEAARSVGSVDRVWSIGGGSATDAAKLLRVLIGRPRLAADLAARPAVGLLYVRVPDKSLPRHHAVLTTVGTGAERSTSVSVRVEGSLVLLKSRAFVPDSSELWRELLASLPHSVAAAGLFEAVFRTIGPVFDTPASPRDERILHTGLALIDATLGWASKLGPEKADCLALAYELGQRSQDPGFFALRTPFAGLPWYVARELQEVIGVSKAEALLFAWSGVARVTAMGESHWSDPERATWLWSRLSSQNLDFTEDPSEGLRRLSAAIRLPDCAPMMRQVDLTDVARRIGSRWSDHALRGIDTSQIREALELACGNEVFAGPVNKRPPVI